MSKFNEGLHFYLIATLMTDEEGGIGIGSEIDFVTRNSETRGS